jgi:multidrug efflux pump subunit AcrA (membrane-fusion protein)
LVADNTLQTLKNQLRANRVRRNRLQIAAQLAQAALQKAQLDLERTKIAAPVDGVIVQDTVEEGSFVQRGTALFTIDDTSSIEVQCSLEMGDLYWLWRQQPASSGVAGFQHGGGRWRGGGLSRAADGRDGDLPVRRPRRPAFFLAGYADAVRGQRVG